MLSNRKQIINFDEILNFFIEISLIHSLGDPEPDPWFRITDPNYGHKSNHLVSPWRKGEADTILFIHEGRGRQTQFCFSLKEGGGRHNFVFPWRKGEADTILFIPEGRGRQTQFFLGICVSSLSFPRQEKKETEECFLPLTGGHLPPIPTATQKQPN